MTSFLTVSGSSSGSEGRRSLGPWVLTNTADAITTEEFDLSAGDNNLAVARNAAAVVLLLPPGTYTAKLKGAGGDQGVPLAVPAPSATAQAVPVVLPLAAGLITLILNASAPVTGCVAVFV